jgi:hypothetical protein
VKLFKSTTTETIVHKYELLALKEGPQRPLKFRASIRKAEKTSNGRTFPFGYQGKTIVFELKDGLWATTVEGGEKPKDLDRLVELVRGEDLDRLFVPTVAVKEKGNWTVDPDRLKNAFLSLDSTKLGQITESRGTLTKVQKQGGKTTGVMKYQLKAAVNAAQGKTFRLGTTVTVDWQLDAAIDGSTTKCVLTAKTFLSGKTTAVVRNRETPVSVQVTIQYSEERSAEN